MSRTFFNFLGNFTYLLKFEFHHLIAAQIVNTQRRRFARSPQSALCPVCTADFLPTHNDPLLTGVNVKGAQFNRNAQINSQQVGKGGTFFNGQSQIGTQKDIGLGGLGFINKGSQVQFQFIAKSSSSNFCHFYSFHRVPRSDAISFLF